MHPHVEAAVLASRQFRREAASARRLQALWRERDAMLDAALDGEEMEEPAMPEEAKTYTCKACDQTFPTSSHLAGHMNRHAWERKRRRPGKSKAERKANGKGRPAANGRMIEAAKAPVGPGCPTCGRALPLGAGVLVEAYTGEGIPEEQAVKLTALAFGLLTTPA